MIQADEVVHKVLNKIGTLLDKEFQQEVFSRILITNSYTKNEKCYSGNRVFIIAAISSGDSTAPCDNHFIKRLKNPPI